ncbi:MAG: lytic murein transglycosylase B [Fluviicoccus sp.]|uniref:lytic murein transglycosylase B n=1 Tax=Fluviicoccus sp. TaxID=2003552 RepID=UPI002728CEE5|nr:lytic murein transglycosylase B [Fluviicoccus sp.]MDO8330758.1 lytic murein transglycosylase B [Fluviicoccus sp.]
MKILRPALALCALLLPVTPAFAGDYDQYEELQALIGSLEKEGIYPPGELTAVFSTVSRQDKGLEAIARPAEKTREWKNYRPNFVSGDRIRKGVEFWSTYAQELDNASQQFGVPPEIIVAIIGVETKYGGNKGNLRVIDSLTSLAFDYPARGSFFRKELRTFLMLAKEQQLDLLQTYGSYAGAMGFPQFMPSSWRNLAIDYSGDGRTDLLNDPVDAIGSVANYFLANGWKTGEAVAVRAQISNDRYDEQLSTDLKTATTLGELATRGLVPREGSFAPETPVAAIRLQGENGAEFWIVFENFFAITRYNRSYNYAMAVFQLSEAIRSSRLSAGIETP